MTTFPAYYKPVYPAEKIVSPGVRNISFQRGGVYGYEQRNAFGINTNRDTWNLTFVQKVVEGSEIYDFLLARKIDRKSFNWTAPDSLIQRRWKCGDFSKEIFDYDSVRITATFIECFEPPETTDWSAFGVAACQALPVATMTAQSDSDFIAWVSAVESADGQELEIAIKEAARTYFSTIKSSGNLWSKTRQLFLSCGPRTLQGALVPVKGQALTNNGFVSGDYSRKGGLGNSGNTSKYLNSNVAISTLNTTANSLFFYGSIRSGSGELALSGWYGSDSSRILLLDELSSPYAGGRTFRSGTNIPAQMPVISSSAAATFAFGSRTSASSSYLIIDSTTVTNTTSLSPNFNSSQTVYYFALNYDGTATAFSTSISQSLGMFDGLTTDEAAALKQATATYVASVNSIL
jgi:phage-related protein